MKTLGKNKSLDILKKDRHKGKANSICFCILGEGEEAGSSRGTERNVTHAVAEDREPSHTRLGRGERSAPLPLRVAKKYMGDGLSPGGKIEQRQPKDPYEARSTQTRFSENSRKSE